MRLLQGIFLCSLCLLVLTGAEGGCRRNAPSLVERNEAPETQLWYAPPDSSEYEYLVHLYWRGTDNDGTVERFIWTVQDTAVYDETSWNPASRLADLRSGRITTRSDSIFSFTAYRNVGGVGLKKNRQAFYIASIDDNGVIDPTPAVVEFVATIDEFPQILFTVHIDGQSLPYEHRPEPLALRDTVGMRKPFAISYRGSTKNGLEVDPATGEIVKSGILGYKWYPLDITIELDGANIWTDDLGDTMRVFENIGDEEIPAKVFRFAATCVDEANAESPIDAGQFSEGVCQIVVNFDPDTEIDGLKSYYFKDGSVHERDIDFTDGVPDTVAYQSWLWVHYAAWDDARDDRACNTTNSDRCIDFQIKYERMSARSIGSSGTSGWVPRGAVHDTDTLSSADSNTVNIGSVEYTLFVRGIDENDKSDGTPAHVEVVGNYDPTLTSIALEDHFGNQVDISSGQVDTLTWNFWKGIGWPYALTQDTLDLADPEFQFFKRFSWRLTASGYDHPDDPAGSGIKSWRYLIYDDEGNYWPLARAGETWVSGTSLDNIDDTFRLTVRYPSGVTPDSPPADPCGDTVFEDLPDYINRDLTIILMGRDTAVEEGEFEQYMFLGEVEDGMKGSHNFAVKTLINAYPTASLGRYTEEQVFTFHFRLIRDPEPVDCP